MKQFVPMEWKMNNEFDIKELENLIDRLESLYNKSYNEVRINENSENKKRISELEERITGEIQEVTNQLKSMLNIILK